MVLANLRWSELVDFTLMQAVKLEKRFAQKIMTLRDDEHDYFRN